MFQDRVLWILLLVFTVKLAAVLLFCEFNIKWIREWLKSKSSDKPSSFPTRRLMISVGLLAALWFVLSWEPTFRRTTKLDNERQVQREEQVQQRILSAPDSTTVVEPWAETIEEKTARKIRENEESNSRTKEEFEKTKTRGSK